MTLKQFKAWRKRMGWTQPQAGEALGYSVGHICRLEAGTKTVQRVTELACRALEDDVNTEAAG